MAIEDHNNPALALVGELANNRWLVTKRLDKKPGGSGGFFSICYEVEDTANGNSKAFLKALNFAAFLQLHPGKRFAEVLKEQTSAYEYERSLLERCRDRNLNNVAIIIDEGEHEMPSFLMSQVPFMVFEMADGDLRNKLVQLSDVVDTSWKLQSLHNIALGIQQLHSVKISHQDLKPSNVLIFNKGITSKIGDLGRSLCQDLIAPHDEDGNFSGDYNYAPIEVFYGHNERDWIRKSSQIDLYMFGNLVCFYFTNMTITSAIFSELHPSFHYRSWAGSFTEVKDFLQEAHGKVIVKLKPYFQDNIEILQLIKFCTNPDPTNRGLPRKATKAMNLPFEPIISKLDLLAKKAEYKALNTLLSNKK